MKAIIVFELDEMPDTCSECRFFDGSSDCKALGREALYCESIDYPPGRDAYCPIKPFPKRKQDMSRINKGKVVNIDGIIYASGYNACINDILGEDDEEC